MSKIRCMLLSLTLLLVMQETAWPQANQHWRYWTAADGLGESFIWCMSVERNGVWFGAGDVEEMSWVDGYAAHPIPNPSSGEMVHIGPSGQIWSATWADHPDVEWHKIGLQQYLPERRRWVSYEIDEIKSASPPIQEAFFFLPAAEDEAIFLLSDRLLEFNAATKRTRGVKHVKETQLERFNQMISARDGGVWIVGERGAARIKGKDRGVDPSAKWIEYLFGDDLGIRDLKFPFEGDNERLFGTAVTVEGAKDVVVCHDGVSWRVLHTADNEDIAGMPGIENSFWILEGVLLNTLASGGLFQGFSLIRVENERRELVAPNKVLSGQTMAQAVEPGGVLWLTTPYGAARYAPPTWRTPTQVVDIDEFCWGIIEDREGRVWLACQHTLVLFQNGEWKTYPLPARTDWPSREGLCPLPDGRIAVRHSDTFTVSDHGTDFVFDPETEKFESIQHPEGRLFSFRRPRKDGSVWASSSGENKVRLEIFDGKTFQVVLEREDWGVLALLDVIETSDGAIWLGGNHFYGLARYKNGVYETFDSTDGFTGGSIGGAFCLLDVGDGKIWFGGRSCVYETDGETFTVVKSDLGPIWSMAKSHDGAIWVASAAGVHRFKDGSWVTNSAEDGLPDAAVIEVFEDSQGRVWAGTMRGFSLYHGEADKDPPETWMEPEKNVEKISSGGEAQFVFSGIDKWKYTEAHRLLYSHRIDGDEWSRFSEDTVATIPGLSAGRHRFEVRAMDRNWNIDLSPASWEFTVLLPWYKESGFIIIVTIGSFLTLFFAGLAISRHLRLRRSNLLLQEANEELRELDEMKSAFVSQASHDLRTPLTAIKSSLDNLVRGVGGGLNERQQRVMGRAVGAVNRLTDLINDVLDISRIESGRMVLEKAKIPFEKLVQDVIHENQPAADQKQIRLEATGLDESYPIELDAGKIERVVGELISNAIKYTPEGGRVDVELRKDGDQHVLAVRDSGIGMTAEECEKIFERFYRTPASQKMSKGSGLGLSIAKELIEMHGGKLTVESRPGEGTTFTLILPSGRS